MFNIAHNTFREILRSRYFSLILFFSIVLFAGIATLNALSLGKTEYVVPDFGFSFLEISGVFVILFLGNRMISREFEERTIYLTLSRPIRRGYIILGKYIGFAVILALLLLIESLALSLLFFLFQLPINLMFFVVIVSTYLKFLMLLALMLFFSIFLSSGMATFLTLASYVIGHNGYALLEYGIMGKNLILEYTAQAILMIFPNLSAINLKNSFHLDIIPDSPYLLITTGFSVLYIVVVLIFAALIFQKKSFANV